MGQTPFIRKYTTIWLTVDYLKAMFGASRQSARLDYAEFMTGQPKEATIRLLRSGTILRCLLQLFARFEPLPFEGLDYRSRRSLVLNKLSQLILAARVAVNRIIRKARIELGQPGPI